MIVKVGWRVRWGQASGSKAGKKSWPRQRREKRMFWLGERKNEVDVVSEAGIQS